VPVLFFVIKSGSYLFRIVIRLQKCKEFRQLAIDLRHYHSDLVVRASISTLAWHQAQGARRTCGDTGEDLGLDRRGREADATLDRL
jgi:hypothetical protein